MENQWFRRQTVRHCLVGLLLLLLFVQFVGGVNTPFVFCFIVVGVA
jgi:hypothetical protein